MSRNRISTVELVVELVGFFGVGRAATLLGYCFLLARQGVESRADIIATEVGSMETRYRVLGDIRRFRVAMIAKGYSMGVDERLAELDLVERLGHVQAG
jgi:hypothetical protein